MLHLEPGSSRRAELAGRHELVIRAYRREWFGAFAREGVEFRTARGFVEAVTTGPAELAECGEEWFTEQPITRLKLTGVYTQSGSYRKWYHRELFRSPLLGRLAALDLSSAGVNAAGVYWLARNPALASLRELSLRSNPINDEGAETLARMSALQNLRSLNVSGTDLADPGAGRSLSRRIWGTGGVADRRPVQRADVGDAGRAVRQGTGAMSEP